MGAQSGQVHGGRGYRFFSTLRQISFLGILVGIITFAWMFYAMIRYRESIIPDTTDVDHIVVGSFLLIDIIRK